MGSHPSSVAGTSEVAVASLDGASGRSADGQSVAEGYEAAAGGRGEQTGVSSEVSVEAVDAFGAEPVLELLPHQMSFSLRGSRSRSWGTSRWSSHSD